MAVNKSKIELEQHENKDVSAVWKCYEDSVAYMSSNGITSQVQKNIDFYEGRQWPAPTKDTLGMPRPIIDITAFTVNNKCANISGVPVKIVYTSTDEEKAKTLNEFAEYWSRQQRFKRKLRKLVNRAAVDCSSCFHLYYHKDTLKLELIDIRNLHVSDPTNDNLQEMDWIIISSRRTVSQVKRMADKGVDVDEIVPDEENLTNNTDAEQKNSKLCTVLTRYQRIDGEVYFSRYTKTTVINAPRPLAPNKKAAEQTEVYQNFERALDEALPTSIKKEKKEGSEATEKTAKAFYYPVFHWAYREKRNCFYGLSLIEPIISDQKAINTTYGLLMLGAQIEATGKTYVKNGALRGQQITNNPLQVVTDYHPTGQGIYKLSPAQMNQAAITLVDTLIKYIRFTNNVTEINTGEAYGANASGSAIAQLQSQASQATDTIREDLWEALEEFGLILKQSFELYFSEGTKQAYKYKIKAPDESGVLRDKDVEGVYDGSRYKDEENSLYDVQIKATKGTRSSVSGDIQMLEAMLQGQMLTAIEFIEMYPDDALTEKDRLISVLKNHQSSQMAALEQKVAQYEQEASEYVKVIRHLSDTLKSHQEKMDAAYKVLSVEEAVKTQAVKEAAGRMNAQTTLTMAEQQLQNTQNAMNAMAADVVNGKIGGIAPSVQKAFPKRKSLAEAEEDS